MDINENKIPELNLKLITKQINCEIIKIPCAITVGNPIRRKIKLPRKLKKQINKLLLKELNKV